MVILFPFQSSGDKGHKNNKIYFRFASRVIENRVRKGKLALHKIKHVWINFFCIFSSSVVAVSG